MDFNTILMRFGLNPDDFENKEILNNQFSASNLIHMSKEKFPQITKDESLLYLLCLCDTAEPFKRCEEIDLSKKGIEFNNSEKTLLLSQCECLTNKVLCGDWLQAKIIYI